MHPRFATPQARLNWVKSVYPTTWRDSRKNVFFGVDRGLSLGDIDREPVWFAESPQFRNETDAPKFSTRLRHTGWYGDTENAEKLHVGFVACLPHGRFLAGYREDDSGTRVYFSRIYSDEFEAANMADEHARIAAEREDEYSQRWNEAQRIEGAIEAKLSDVEKSFALRNHPKLGAKERKWTREVIADIRGLRVERESLNVD